MSRAGLDKQPHDVAAMFDAVARRYDLTNDVLTVGLDRRWRQAVVAAVAPAPEDWILDLAAGTGTSSAPLHEADAAVVACDFSLGMLAEGKRRRPQLAFVAGDATQLPFRTATFDAVTISFGLRNLTDPDAGLGEMARVTKPGGRLVVCEFSHPRWWPLRTAYESCLLRALPGVARAVSSNPDAYAYLAESIRAWPDQPALAGQIRGAGWTDVRWRNLTAGIVALHHAIRA